jgi:hypothetical protein
LNTEHSPRLPRSPRRFSEWLPLLLGSALLAVSLYPLFREAQEAVLGHAAYRHYSVKPLRLDGVLSFGEASIKINRVADGDLRVSVDVDGREHLLEVPRREDSQRSSGTIGRSLAATELDDKISGEHWLTVTLGSGGEVSESWSYCILFVSPTGSTREEKFGYAKRGSPLYRTMLIRFGAPEYVGFSSDALAYIPTLWRPVLYPWSSACLGATLIAVGLVKMGRRRKTATVTE